MPTPAGRIRVLWLVKGLGPGGAERLLVSAAGRHDRERFDLRCLYLLPWKQQLVPELEALGVPTTCLDVRNERDLRWAVRLRADLLASPVDIVHTHSPYPGGIARMVVPTLPRARRPSTMYTVHNTWESFAVPSRILNGSTMVRDAAVLAVSELVRSSMPPRLARRTEVLVHGVDLAQIAGRRDRDAVRAELGLGPDEFAFGTVANLRVQKDYPNLLAAAVRLRDRGTNIRIVAVGQGPLEEEIAAQHRRLGLEHTVQLLGERSDAVRVMSGCDAFVLASSNEGLPVALMEAAALGVPIVATRVGGVPEIVDDTDGVLVPARDPDALAGAMAALASDPSRRAALAAGSLAVAPRFDIRRTVDRLETIYTAAAGARRP